MTISVPERRSVGVDAFAAGIRECFPGLSVGPLRVVEGFDRGWTNETCFAGEDLVFQTPIDDTTHDTFQLQRRLLPRLAPTLPCRVPDFAFYAEHCAAVDGPLAGYHRVKGKPLSVPTLQSMSPHNRRRLAAQIASLLRALHAFPVDEARAAGVREEIVERVEWITNTLVTRVEEHLPAHLRQLARQRMAACLDAARSLRQPLILIHSDLVERHLIIDSDQLSGVIDWGGVTLGDLAYELANPLYFYGREFIEEILADYPDPGDALRVAAEVWVPAIPIAWLDHAVDSGDTEFFAAAVERFAEHSAR